MIISPDSCAINERTADGISVGRCYFHVENDMCPRHGNVKSVQDHYRLTGQLTDEQDFPRLPLPPRPPIDPANWWSRFKKWW